ncbi:MAG: CPCC family cysteine-rich protein [Planctomycetaceae bacterium]
MGNVTCFICGHRTLDKRCDWDICPVCFWEDDVFVTNGEDIASVANHGMMVSQAQANFIMFGASSKDAIPHVRPPKYDEEYDSSWTPLKAALQLVERTKNDG